MGYATENTVTRRVNKARDEIMEEVEAMIQNTPALGCGLDAHIDLLHKPEAWVPFIDARIDEYRQSPENTARINRHVDGRIKAFADANWVAQDEAEKMVDERITAALEELHPARVAEFQGIAMRAAHAERREHEITHPHDYPRIETRRHELQQHGQIAPIFGDIFLLAGCAALVIFALAGIYFSFAAVLGW